MKIFQAAIQCDGFAEIKTQPSLAYIFLALLAFAPSHSYAQTDYIIMGSTNQGELVKIDLNAGWVTLVGTAPSPGGWSDLAMDEEGNLFAVSRHRVEASSVCVGVFATGPCSHLYRLNPRSGSVIEHVGDLEIAYVADIDFTDAGVLFASRYVDASAPQEQDDGGLVTIDPETSMHHTGRADDLMR